MASVDLNTLSALKTSDSQKAKAIAEDLRRLEQDISSGNLSAAQQDFATLRSQLPDTTPAASVSSLSSPESLVPTISLEQLFDQLGGGVRNVNQSVVASTAATVHPELLVAATALASDTSDATGATLDAYV